MFLFQNLFKAFMGSWDPSFWDVKKKQVSSQEKRRNQWTSTYPFGSCTNVEVKKPPTEKGRFCKWMQNGKPNEMG